MKNMNGISQLENRNFKFKGDAQAPARLLEADNQVHFSDGPGRFVLREDFKQRPALNAVLDLPGSDSTSPTAAAFLAYTVANKDFEVLGTNATTALVTFSTTEGGILLTTAGADNDSIIILPHLNTNQSAWQVVEWGTENQVVWEATLRTGAAVSTVTLWAGLKLTNTDVIATDNDQCFFRFDTDASDVNWQCVTSRSGTDVTVDSGVAVAASTVYRLRIIIDSARRPHFFINGIEVGNSTTGSAALTNDIDLIPYVGVAQRAGSITRTLTLCKEAISRIVFE